MKLALSCIVTVLLGCASEKIVHTPDVDIHQDGGRTEVNSTGRYEQCLKDLFKLLPEDTADPRYAEISFAIEEKCHGRTTGTRTDSSVLGGSFVAPMMIGPGMMAPTDPRAYAGLPGGQPFMITPTAVAALEHHPGNVVPVMVPSGAAASAAGSDDLTLIVREQAQQHKRLCDIEKKQGKPCKK